MIFIRPFRGKVVKQILDSEETLNIEPNTFDKCIKVILISVITSLIFNKIMSMNCPPLWDINYKKYMIIWAILFILGFILEMFIIFMIIEREDKENKKI